MDRHNKGYKLQNYIIGTAILLFCDPSFAESTICTLDRNHQRSFQATGVAWDSDSKKAKVTHSDGKTEEGVVTFTKKTLAGIATNIEVRNDPSGETYYEISVFPVYNTKKHSLIGASYILVGGERYLDYTFQNGMNCVSL